MCIYINELRTNFGTWQRDILKYGGPLSILQWWQPHDPLNTTLVLPNFVRYSNISYIFIHCIVYEYMMNMILIEYVYTQICMALHGWDFIENSLKKAHLKPPAPKSAVETRHSRRSHFGYQLSHFGFNNFAQIRKVLIQIPDRKQLDQPLYHAKVQHTWMGFSSLMHTTTAPMSTDVMKRRTSPSAACMFSEKVGERMLAQ